MTETHSFQQNVPGMQCMMFGNARHTDAADTQTFGFSKSQTFCSI